MSALPVPALFMMLMAVSVIALILLVGIVNESIKLYKKTKKSR